MIGLETAKKLVLEYLAATNEHKDDPDLEYLIYSVIEKEYGWVFFYNSRRYLEKEDLMYFLFGAFPILIDKEDGSMRKLVQDGKRIWQDMRQDGLADRKETARWRWRSGGSDAPAWT